MRSLLVALAVIIASPSLAQQAVVVRAGGMEGGDACYSIGKVVGLNKKGDNFLSVRSGPSSRNEELTRLRSGQTVSLCDFKPGWYGIAYGGSDCNYTSQSDNMTPYKGPCRTGWVSMRFIKDDIQ